MLFNHKNSSSVPFIFVYDAVGENINLPNVGLYPSFKIKSDVDDLGLKKGYNPRVYSLELAYNRCIFVSKDYPEDLVVATSVIVACGKRVLQATFSEEIARKNLLMLSGRRHKVYNSVCIMGLNRLPSKRTVVNIVKFKRLHQSEIDRYISAGEWQGQQGSYYINGLAAEFIACIKGTTCSVIGVPIFEMHSLLKSYTSKPEIHTDE